MQSKVKSEEDQAQKAIRIIHGAISEVLGLQKGRKGVLSPVALSILYTTTVKKIRMNDVAEAYDIRKSTASRYVDSLEEKGLVRRNKDRADMRIVYVVPTAKGKALIAENEKKLADYVDNSMGRLNPAERETFIELLSKFTGAK